MMTELIGILIAVAETRIRAAAAGSCPPRGR